MKNLTVAKSMLLGMAVLSLALFINYCYPRDYYTKFDDAYMSLRYARHWLAGDGFSWNVADGPAYGITSVSHLMIITGLCATTNLSDNLLVTGLSYVSGLAAVFSLVIIGFVMFPHLRKTWLPLLIVPAILLSSAFSFHSTTGMETTLALLANSLFAASALGYARKPNLGRMTICLGMAMLSFLTRPDMGLYCFLVPPLFLLAEDRKNWKQGLFYGISLGALLLIDLLIDKQLFGDYLPLPFSAKQAGFYRGYLGVEKWNPGKMMFTFMHDALPFLVVLVCCVTRASLGKLAAIFIPMVLTFIYYGTVMQIMGHEARYYYPSLAFLVFASFIACDTFLEQWKAPVGESLFNLLPKVSAALMLVIIFNAPMVDDAMSSIGRKVLMKTPEKFTRREFHSNKDPRKLPIYDWWEAIQFFEHFVHQLPEEITFATSEHGYLGALHPNTPIIDLVGLHDRHVAKNGFSPEYMISRQPDIIWLPHADYGYLHEQVSFNDEFADQYEYYPYVFVHGIAIRKASPLANQIREVLAKDFPLVYPGEVLSDYKAEFVRDKASKPVTKKPS